MSCFAALGLTDDATLIEVRQAYHDKARLLHPDAGIEVDCGAFAQLRENYAACIHAIETRKCPTCKGTRKVTHTVGWSSVESRCPSCS